MNVIDSLKEKTVEESKTHCVATAVNAAVAMMHVSGDFNLSTVMRNANFFGFKEVFYIGGKKAWDRRGAVGVQNYTPLHFCKTEEEFLEIIKDKYTLISIENNIPEYAHKTISLFRGGDRTPVDLFDHNTWDINPLFIFGEEQLGISKNVLDKSKFIVTIPQYGSVRSLNVGTCSGIVMAKYRELYEDHLLDMGRY